MLTTWLSAPRSTIMMAVPPLVLVVLDLDNTLFDHTASARAGLDEWLEGHEVAMTQEIADAWFAAEDEHHQAWTRGLASFAEHRRRRLRQVLPMIGLPVGDDARLDAMFAEYLQHYQGAWRAFDDASDALTAVHARGLSTAVLTNGMRAQQRAKLERIDLLERVGSIFTAEDLGVAKPSPRAFAMVCAALDLEPASVVHVGDNYALDVIAARGAGLRAVHLDRTGAGPTDEHGRITTLADLADLLDERS